MERQVFKLSDIQINYLELFEDNDVLSSKNFNFDNNTVMLTDSELETLFEQITKYHADDLMIFNDILNEIIKQDRNNVVKECNLVGLTHPII